MTVKGSMIEVPKWLVPVMFAGLYTAWSTTYLAIHYMVLTMPPYLASGFRFIAAGAILFLLSARKAEKPSPRNWRDTAITGGFIILLGNGSIVWAQQFIPSSLAALLIATVPMWIVLLNWLLFRQARPTFMEFSGVCGGFLGIAMLIGFSRITAGESFSPVGVAVVLAASFFWATGSLYSRYGNLPPSPLLSVSMQMLAGGALMLVVSLFSGEIFSFDPGAVSLFSLIGWAHLVVFGSLVGFVCYLTLMRSCQPSKVATYAYVTPVGAVFLGWAVAGETITGQTLIATAVILFSVFVIITFGPRER